MWLPWYGPLESIFGGKTIAAIGGVMEKRGQA